MLYWTMSIGVAKLTYVFLSWLNEQLLKMDLILVLIIFFTTGLTMFLLPPVPGIPVYILSGILIAARTRNMAEIGGFWGGVLIATMESFVLKLMAVAGQYMIGLYLGKSVKVQQLIAVDKVITRSIEKILQTRGLNLPKVSVLVGGPDWPTSVLTGILDLPLCSMLYGTLPVVFLIAPCCISGGFLLRAAEESDDGKKGIYHALQEISGVIAIVLPATINVLMVHYVQVITTEFHTELNNPESTWQQDPQEAAIKERVETDEALAEKYSARNQFRKQPPCLQILSVLGAGLSSLATYLLLFGRPVRKFKLEQSASELPNGRITGLIEPTGWGTLAISGLVAIILTIVLTWMSRRAAFEESDYDCMELPLDSYDKDSYAPVTPSLVGTVL